EDGAIGRLRLSPKRQRRKAECQRDRQHVPELSHGKILLPTRCINGCFLQEAAPLFGIGLSALQASPCSFPPSWERRPESIHSARSAHLVNLFYVVEGWLHRSETGAG